ALTAPGGGAPVRLGADPRPGAVGASLSKGYRFAGGPAGKLAEPARGLLWSVEEDALVPPPSESTGDPPPAPLARLPGHRVYWFGWFAFFPETSRYEGCGRPP